MPLKQLAFLQVSLSPRHGLSCSLLRLFGLTRSPGPSHPLPSSASEAAHQVDGNVGFYKVALPMEHPWRGFDNIGPCLVLLWTSFKTTFPVIQDHPLCE